MNIVNYFRVITFSPFLLWFVGGAKILGVFPSPGPSQYILAERLLLPLAERGHDVTVISAFETKGKSNFRNVKFEIQHEKLKGNTIDLQDIFSCHNLNIFQFITGLYQMTTSIAEMILSDSKVQALIRSNETFDVVIVEQFHGEIYTVFAEFFDAHLISFGSLRLNEWSAHLMGNPIPPSYVPHSLTGYSSQMNFYQRFTNSVAFTFDTFMKYFIALPGYQKLVDKYFPKKLDVYRSMYNSSLMLQNSHPILTEAMPLTNAIIEIGGFHIKSSPLAKDIQRFLDGATKGAIFFSLGTNLKSADLPKDILNGILNAMRKSEQKFLWKFETDDLSDIPENLFIAKWLPQSDILAHPNVIGFISHCGLLSATESVHYGVPIIAMPIFLDQEANAKLLVESGIAVYLPYEELREDTLFEAVREIVSNKTYMKNAKIRSKLFRDRIVHPLDEAIYWVEYVIRHGGAHHLRNKILTLNWAQLYLLDVACVVIVGFLIVIYATRWAIRIMCNKCISGANVEKQKKKL